MAIITTRGFPNQLIQAISSLYRDTKIVVDIGKSLSEDIVINQGVRQGCSLSSTLLNIYLDDLIRNWKVCASPGIPINKQMSLNSMLFADDQVIIQTSQDALQRSIYHLHVISKNYNLRISLQKTKTMAFKGKDPVRTKIIIDNTTLEQVSHFTYLGCNITTYEYDKAIHIKLGKYQQMCGTITRTL